MPCPDLFSRREIWRLIADGVCPSEFATAVKLPSSTTRTKTAMSGSSSIRLFILTVHESCSGNAHYHMAGFVGRCRLKSETDPVQKEMKVFERLCGLLAEHDARFRVIDHAPEGNSEKVAAIRGTMVGQGAKAMICSLKNAGFHVMTVVPGDRKVDFKKVARQYGLSKASLLAADEAVALTGCAIGAIPPFAFDAKLKLLVDSDLMKRFDEIAFNAGRLDKSIVLASTDYMRIANPDLADITVMECS